MYYPKVSIICPRITTLNLVAGDEFMPDYAQMSQLTKVSVELEDCFGVGIYRFLQMVGHQLTELSLSCSSGKQKEKFLLTKLRPSEN